MIARPASDLTTRRCTVGRQGSKATRRWRKEWRATVGHHLLGLSMMLASWAWLPAARAEVRGGTERWAVRVGTDLKASTVDVGHPTPITVADLNALPQLRDQGPNGNNTLGSDSPNRHTACPAAGDPALVAFGLRRQRGVRVTPLANWALSSRIVRPARRFPVGSTFAAAAGRFRTLRLLCLRLRLRSRRGAVMER